MTIHLTDTVTLNDKAIKERFIRSQGARGQNAEHDPTAVELRLDLARAALSPEVTERLTALAGRHITDNGVLVVTSRTFKSQTANREAARKRLFTLLLRASKEPTARKPTKPRRADREQRLVDKHVHSNVKALRGRARSDD